MDSVQHAIDNYHKVTTPCYILQGRQDNIVKPAGANKYFENIGIKDKTLIMLDDMDHFIVRNQKINFFMNDVVFWMLVHSK